MLLAPFVCFHILVKVTEWPPIGKIAAHSAYEMFSWYKYLIISLVFSHLGFWSGNLFLIAPFPDLCLLVPFQTAQKNPPQDTKQIKLQQKYRLRTISNITLLRGLNRFYRAINSPASSAVVHNI